MMMGKEEKSMGKKKVFWAGFGQYVTKCNKIWASRRKPWNTCFLWTACILYVRCVIECTEKHSRHLNKTMSLYVCTWEWNYNSTSAVPEFLNVWIHFCKCIFFNNLCVRYTYVIYCFILLRLKELLSMCFEHLQFKFSFFLWNRMSWSIALTVLGVTECLTLQ